VFRSPNMLMIGSAQRKIGKTELACRLIGRYGAEREVIGVKVTTIHDPGAECPHGLEGCGACTNFTGDYCITEETVSGPPGKDTVRMLEAGAARVLWLRIPRDRLAEGVTALLDRIDPGAVVVCESNSMRTAVEPALFLMVESATSDEYKPAAREMRGLADRIVRFDGARFDADLNDITIVDGTWALKEDAAAIIVAGGASTRMGGDKGLLPIDGRPMIEYMRNKLRPHFKELLISANDPQRYAFLGLRVVKDGIPARVPLAGIASTVEASAHDVNAAVACDMPGVDVALIRRMLRECGGYDGVVPVMGDSSLEPLCAVYRKSIVSALNEARARGAGSIKDVFKYCRIKYIHVEDVSSFRNINTVEDYEKYIKARRTVGEEKEII
jgi:molybdopterin-guanine dinucleotide biosynthesis protein A